MCGPAGPPTCGAATAPGGRGPAGCAPGGGPLCGGSAPPTPPPIWACAENAKTVSAAASGRTILDRREAVILGKPLFRRALAETPPNRHGPLLLTGFVAAC